MLSTAPALATTSAAAFPLPSHQPSWQQQLSTSLKRSSRSPTAKYLQLATVTPDGLPAVRTLVFRGWLWQTCTLMMITDARSSKLEHIAQQRRCEVAWYIEKTREQYRIRGEMRAVYADEPSEKLRRARLTVWRNLSDSARAQFDDPTPGVPIGELLGHPGALDTAVGSCASTGEARANDDGKQASDKTGADAPPPSLNFVLLLMRPDGVDQLCLSRPQRRWIHELCPEEGAPGLEAPGETAPADDAAAAAAWRTVEVNP
eukprot:scaffold303729_cov30-Tisochrysis_lutea.AAC.1